MSQLKVENRFSGIDLLLDLHSLAYFEMKGVLIHYFSLSSKEYRRNFNLEVASAIDDFNRLPAIAKSALHQLFSIGYREPEPTIGKTRTDSRRLPLLQSIPSANSYFSIDDLADVKALNNAYRRNAKTHHPDSGGSHELMVELNSIFNKLQESLITDNYLQPAHDDMSFKVTKDYVEIDTTPLPHSTWCNWIGPLAHGNFSHGLRVFHPSDVDKALALLRASIAIDEYDLRSAVNFINPILKKIHNGRNDFGRNAATIEASIQLCRRLRAAKLDAEAAEMSLNISSSKLKLHPYWSHMEKALVQVMNQAERPKVNPLHPRQRGNLEKFDGAAKVGTAKRLLRAKQTKEKLFCDAITALGGFITLPTDPVGVPLSAFAIRNVPQVNSSTTLSADHIGEYHFTFYKSPSLDLVKKHLTLRCDIWFCSLFDVTVPIDLLLTEISLVAHHIPQTLNRTPASKRIGSLIHPFTFMDFVDVFQACRQKKSGNGSIC